MLLIFFEKKNLVKTVFLKSQTNLLLSIMETKSHIAKAIENLQSTLPGSELDKGF